MVVAEPSCKIEIRSTGAPANPALRFQQNQRGTMGEPEAPVVPFRLLGRATTLKLGAQGTCESGSELHQQQRGTMGDLRPQWRSHGFGDIASTACKIADHD